MDQTPRLRERQRPGPPSRDAAEGALTAWAHPSAFSDLLPSRPGLLRWARPETHGDFTLFASDQSLCFPLVILKVSSAEKTKTKIQNTRVPCQLRPGILKICNSH